MKRSVRALLFTGLLAVLCSGCAHRTSPLSTLHAQLLPFQTARDQTIALITAGKHALDPGSINQLNVAYATLEVKANNYVGFIIESLDVGTLDAQKQAAYSADLANALDGFNHAYNSFRTSQMPTANLSTGWIQSSADELRASWKDYQSSGSSISVEEKARVAEEIKKEAVWPDFQYIATESLGQP